MDRITAALAKPWIIALLLAPFALWLWALRLNGGTQAGFEVFQLAFLGAGGGLYLLARRGASRGPSGGLRAAGIAAFVAIAAQMLVAQATWPPNQPMAALAASLARMVLFIALAEELWFRGLWMQACRRNARWAIVVGALLFGLYHWPMGLGTVCTTTAIGALYAAVRWHGAPIWTLTLVHGGVNWVSSSLAPAAVWRFDAALAQGVFTLIVLGSAGALITRTPNREETS
jgi:membrane protease YdiL (CAAX protease family)